MFLYESDVEMTQSRMGRVEWSLNSIIWLNASFLYNDIECSGLEILTAHVCQPMQLTPMRDTGPMQFLMLYFRLKL